MNALKRPKLITAGATDELQLIEQFGRSLGVENIETLKLLQQSQCHVLITQSHPRLIGKMEVRIHGCDEILLVSRQPLFDGARLLLAIGCRLDAMIWTRRLGATGNGLGGKLGVAAKLTVDETNGVVLTTWKSFPGSSVSPKKRSNVSKGASRQFATKAHERTNRRAGKVLLVQTRLSS